MTSPFFLFLGHPSNLDKIVQYSPPLCHSKKVNHLSVVTCAFTLVELLVVISIIGLLAGLAIPAISRAQKSAQNTTSISNLRQIGVLLNLYSSENSGRLPAARQQGPELHWFEELIPLAYPTVTNPTTWKGPSPLPSTSWWKKAKPVLRNPLVDQAFKPGSPSWWNPGYGMNLRIGNNLYGYSSNSMEISIPLMQIPQPSRTPVISPSKEWNYYDPTMTNTVNTNFLINGNLSILFVDGHVESMTPQKYMTDGLDKYPRQ